MVNGLFAVLLSFPTIVYSFLMGPVLLYWSLVILGALDFDTADADIDVDADVDADVGTEAEPEADVGQGAASSAFALFGLLRLRKVPITISISALVVCSWALSYFGEHFIRQTLEAALPHAFGSMIIGLGALVAAWPMALLVTRPMESLFNSAEAPQRKRLVGSAVEVLTGRVDKTFGQASFNDGAAGFLLQVRCSNEQGLKKGDQALIISYDSQADEYEVVPMDEIMGAQHSGSVRVGPPR